MEGPSDKPDWNRKLQQEAATTIFQFSATLFEGSVAWARSKFAWERASQTYVSRWIDRWGQIHPLGADQPIPLHQIYVNVRTVPRSYVQRFANIEELEASTRKGGNRNLFGVADREHKPISGMTIANQHERLLILGSPGAGKSTFLRRVGLEALLPREEGRRGSWRFRGEYIHAVLPVMLELRMLRNEVCAKPEDVLRLIVGEFVTSGFPHTEALVSKAAEAGSLLLLLDGVDEIPTANLDLAVRAIRDFVHRYPKCRFILSCRSAFYRDWFDGFSDFLLADFDNSQISDFAKNWFTRPDEIAAGAAAGFLQLLASDDHRATRELAGSPLMLTFLCLVFRKTQQFPANRAQVYQKALRIYLEEWNAHKFTHHDRLYQDLTPEAELELLKDIAGPAFIEDRYFFTGGRSHEGYQNVFRQGAKHAKDTKFEAGSGGNCGPARASHRKSPEYLDVFAPDHPGVPCGSVDPGGRPGT